MTWSGADGRKRTVDVVQAFLIVAGVVVLCGFSLFWFIRLQVGQSMQAKWCETAFDKVAQHKGAKWWLYANLEGGSASACMQSWQKLYFGTPSG